MKNRSTLIRQVLVLVALLAGSNFTTRAQTGGVGIGTTTPNGQFEVATPGTIIATEQSYQASPQVFGMGMHPYTVPDGVTALAVDATGGKGQADLINGGGGYGARVQATLSVTPGETLYLYVGGMGRVTPGGYPYLGKGGFNGGGGNMAVGGTCGGGATDIRRGGTALANRLLVAGGGGGGQYGGAAGAPNGNAGTVQPGAGGWPGGGGTQSAGGAGGGGGGQDDQGYSGTLGQGGEGGYNGPGEGSAGGGGGYYGGGGALSAGGGGGSSWATPTGITGTLITGAYGSGDGTLTITPGLAYAAPVLSGDNFVNLPNTATASNGLTKTGNNIALGGTLTGATTIAQAGNNFSLTGGNVGIGMSAPQATLELARGFGLNGTLGIMGTTRESHFNYATAEDTYVRGGKATSNVLLNDNGGNVGIGTATPNYKLEVNGSTGIDGANTLEFGAGVAGKEISAGKIGYGAFSSGASLDIVGAGTTNNNRVVRVFAEGGAYFNGPVTGVGAFNSSDSRLKQAIRPLTGALALVQALHGRRYQWNALGVQRGGRAQAEQVGVIAQELEQVLPELVSTGPDGFKAVNYAQLTPVLIEALKEQQQQIETLKAQNQALQTRTALVEADHASLLTLQAQLARLLGEGTQAQK